jgi:hypothetical protein
MIARTVMRIALVSSLVLAAACGGSTSAVDPIDPVHPGGEGAPGASSGGSGSGSSAPEDAHPGGARLTVALRGSSAPIPHTDGFSGQTPSRQIVAIRSLWLYRSATDPSPLRVLDLGKSSVETDLATGTTVDIGTVALRSLPAGHYTVAKVGAAYVRYSIATRLHSTLTLDGRYDNVQALSEGAVIDGQTRGRGWYRYSFAVGSTTYGAVEGADAPLPKLPAAGGISLESEGPESFYVFPTSVTIDPDEPKDQRVVCEVNVYESFRWQDQDLPGYAARVYDTTPTTFEPVMAFGASAFSLNVEGK